MTAVTEPHQPSSILIALCLLNRKRVSLPHFVIGGKAQVFDRPHPAQADRRPSEASPRPICSDPTR